MSSRGSDGSVLHQLLPHRLRLEIYRVRALGPARYARYRWHQQALRDVPEPQAGAPYDIGGLAPIVLPQSVVGGFGAHFVDRGHGTAELDAFKRLAAGHRAFLDVGAAAGLFAAAFCAFTGNRSYAFEPSPRNFARMRELMDANPELQIEPHDLALGAKAGSLAIDSSHGAQYRGVADAGAGDGETDGASSAQGAGGSSGGGETMTVATLDEFAREHQLAPDFAKIDVEGMELEVLRGGAQTFTDSIDALLLEVHPKLLMGGASVSEVQALLRDFGFHLMTLDFKPIDDLARYVEARRGRAARAANIVCRK